VRGVEKANIVIHVVQVLVAETLDILVERHRLLYVFVVGWVPGEDGIVDDDAIDLFVVIC
jgi:hypothetical protein